jgi:ribosomal protein S25
VRTDQNLPENYYSVVQVAQRLNISHDLARKMFMEEPGVLALVRPAKRHKRIYTTLRVPESVLQRVITRLEVR